MDRMESGTLLARHGERRAGTITRDDIQSLSLC